MIRPLVSSSRELVDGSWYFFRANEEKKSAAGHLRAIDRRPHRTSSTSSTHSIVSLNRPPQRLVLGPWRASFTIQPFGPGRPTWIHLNRHPNCRGRYFFWARVSPSSSKFKRPRSDEVEMKKCEALVRTSFTRPSTSPAVFFFFFLLPSRWEMSERYREAKKKINSTRTVR